jgi:catechol 2,3-dioxygenase-like lactoylglutathione lyase family enzyme
VAYAYTFTRLLVRDFAANYRFYRDAMGFTAAFGEEHDVYADFKTGEVTIALFDRGAMAEAVGTTDLPPTASAQDTVALCFAVENVDAACADLRARGVSFVTEPQDRSEWMIRTAHFRDPEGNLLEIFSAIAVATPESGS